MGTMCGRHCKIRKHLTVHLVDERMKCKCVNNQGEGNLASLSRDVKPEIQRLFCPDVALLILDYLNKLIPVVILRERVSVNSSGEGSPQGCPRVGVKLKLLGRDSGTWLMREIPTCFCPLSTDAKSMKESQSRKKMWSGLPLTQNKRKRRREEVKEVKEALNPKATATVCCSEEGVFVFFEDRALFQFLWREGEWKSLPLPPCTFALTSAPSSLLATGGYLTIWGDALSKIALDKCLSQFYKERVRTGHRDTADELRSLATSDAVGQILDFKTGLWSYISSFPSCLHAGGSKATALYAYAGSVYFFHVKGSASISCKTQEWHWEPSPQDVDYRGWSFVFQLGESREISENSENSESSENSFYMIRSWTRKLYRHVLGATPKIWEEVKTSWPTIHLCTSESSLLLEQGCHASFGGRTVERGLCFLCWNLRDVFPLPEVFKQCKSDKIQGTATLWNLH